jgi:GDSL-like Lipase/Acylhydrolase family
MSEPVRTSTFIGSLAASTALLVVGLCPLPDSWARTARDSAQSPELNRADREIHEGGYYEGLISGGVGPEGACGELALRLLGKPANWVRFLEVGINRVSPHDFIQYDLLPNQNRVFFGQPFSTNSFGMRDRPYSLEKPPGTFRIVLMGSSIDMGWGVSDDETYENRLERWLNQYAEKRGLARRFEVLNFAMAAYGPAERLESFHRKAEAFHPDLVLYSATMLDLRLLEIHLCTLLQNRIELRYDFLRQAVARAGLTEADLSLSSEGLLLNKETIKSKLQPQYWPIIDATLGELAAECRSKDRPLVCLIIPRAGKADAPSNRADSVAQYKAIASHHGVPVVDLSATFDNKNPAEIEIAAWDDHPNGVGHKLLFVALARALVDTVSLYQLFFGTY